jgi:DNA polymerase elongation subunit (family B)
MYKYVVAFDLNSLYPHIIMQYNMSPETIVNHRVSGIDVDYLLKVLDEDLELDIPENYTMTATGQCFLNNKSGIIPEVIQQYYNERAEVKAEMLKLKQELENNNKSKDLKTQIGIMDNIQMSIKIMMNSLYGAIANKYFRYFDVRMAEAITISGQLTIRWGEIVLNKYMNELVGTENVDYVIAIDTDSVYVNMEPLVIKFLGEEHDTNKAIDFLAKAGPKFEKKFEKGYAYMAKKLQAPQQKMVMGREIIADKAIWTAKKRYIANVWDNEGVRYKEPHLKIVGIEAVRSSTPKACQDMIKELLKLIMHTDERTVQKEISKKRELFRDLSPEDIAFPRGISDLEKYMDRKTVYSKGAPMHCRAALLYNQALKDYNITSSYDSIQSGNKMKFMYMKMPNPLHENVFGFENVFPRETDLVKYVDYDLQFEKALVDALQPIMKAVGWTPEKRGTLEGLF